MLQFLWKNAATPKSFRSRGKWLGSKAQHIFLNNCKRYGIAKLLFLCWSINAVNKDILCRTDPGEKIFFPTFFLFAAPLGPRAESLCRIPNMCTGYFNFLFLFEKFVLSTGNISSFKTFEAIKVWNMMGSDIPCIFLSLGRGGGVFAYAYMTHWHLQTTPVARGSVAERLVGVRSP